MNNQALTVGYYEAILHSGNVTVEDGMLFSPTDTDFAPVVDSTGKTIVLPIPSVLADTNWDENTGFHPLCEDISRGQSEIIKTLTSILVAETNIRFGTLIMMLLSINAAGDKGGVRPPAQQELFKVLAGADKKFYTYVMGTDKIAGILTAVDANDPNKQFVRLRLRRRTEVDGVEYRRYCTASFPMIPTSDKDKVFGIAGRDKDVAMWGKFVDYLLGTDKAEETYSYGTQRTIAPNLGVLLGSYSRISERINYLVDTFVEAEPALADLRVSLAFNAPEYLESLRDMAESIPPLQGNTGVVSRLGEEAQEIKLGDPTPAPTIRREAKEPAPIDLPWEDKPQQHAAPTAQPDQAPSASAPPPPGGERVVSVAEMLAAVEQQRLAANPAAALLAQQQQALVAQQANLYANSAPPPDPNTLAGMLAARNQAANLVLGTGNAPGTGVGLSPFDTEYRPPAQPTTVAAPMQRPSW